MAPPPALAYQHVDPLADAVELLLHALNSAHADRIVLASNQIPMLLVGSRKCALMVGRLTPACLQQLAPYLFPPACLDALEEIGGTRCRWAGHEALAEYGEFGLTIEIKRVLY